MDLSIEIAGNRVAVKQHGKEALSAPLADFLALLADHSDHCWLPEPIPEGVRFLYRRFDTMVLVIEEKPQLRTVRWLEEGSPAPFGPEARYRIVRLAFPFVVLVLVLRAGQLTRFQQCFYRNAPLTDLSDWLSCPNLPNVAKVQGQPCWLCLANLAVLPPRWEDKVTTLRTHLWGAGFNRSSEINEGMSYWSFPATRHLDPRVKSLAAWEAASRSDPFFPLELPWPAVKTLGQVMHEMLDQVAPARAPSAVTDLVPFVNACQGAARKRWSFLSALWARL